MGVRTPGEFGSREPGGGDGVVGPLPGQQFSVELGDLEPAGGTSSNSSVWVRLARSRWPWSLGEGFHPPASRLQWGQDAPHPGGGNRPSLPSP